MELNPCFSPERLLCRAGSVMPNDNCTMKACSMEQYHVQTRVTMGSLAIGLCPFSGYSLGSSPPGPPFIPGSLTKALPGPAWAFSGSLHLEFVPVVEWEPPQGTTSITISPCCFNKAFNLNECV